MYLKILIILVVLLVTIFFVIRNKNKFIVENVETLTMAMLIGFFKDDKILTKLKKDKNLLAVAIMEEDDEKKIIVCTLFNSSTERIEKNIKNTLIYHAKHIDENILSQFEDKKMIILT